MCKVNCASEVHIAKKWLKGEYTTGLRKINAPAIHPLILVLRCTCSYNGVFVKGGLIVMLVLRNIFSHPES